MPTPDTPAGIAKEMDLMNRVDVLRPAPEVFQRLSVGLDLPELQEKQKSGKSLMQESWEAMGNERQRKLREELAKLESIQARTGLGLRAAPDKVWFQKNMESILGVRQSALATVLTGMRRTYLPDASAFLVNTTGNPKDDIEEDVIDLEELVWNPPEEGEKNPLYVWDRQNKRFTPNFPVLMQKQVNLQRILLHGIRSDVDPKMQQLTRERVEHVQHGLRLIASMHPINEKIFLAMQGSGLLSTPLRLAAFGAAAVLGVLSLIPILKKLAHGDPLETSDWPAAVWPALAAYIGGFVPGASQGVLVASAKANITVQGNEQFRNAVAKMGGKDLAQNAVWELHDLLQTADKQKKLKRALDLGKIPKEFLSGDDGFTGQNDPDKSPLLKALTHDALTDEDRHAFLGPLYDLKVVKEKNLDAMIMALNTLG